MASKPRWKNAVTGLIFFAVLLGSDSFGKDCLSPEEMNAEPVFQRKDFSVAGVTESSRTSPPPQPFPGQEWANELGIIFVWIPPGSFLMGSPGIEAERRSDEGPVRRVKIPSGFWLGKHEITQEEWYSVMGENPSSFKDCGGSCPVEMVSWKDTQAFINRMNTLTSEKGYRLPSEAEWEYAARAGNGQSGASDLDLAAWHQGNSGDTPHPVGFKEPNAWGLHDMLGNVWEWCQDSYQAYPGGTADNTRSSGSGISFVRRGCSWSSDRAFCRPACRSRHAPENRFSSLGLRLFYSPGQ